MLILARRVGEKINIGNDVTITICQIKEHGNVVSLGIEAPKDVIVDREAVAERRKANPWPTKPIC